MAKIVLDPFFRQENKESEKENESFKITIEAGKPFRGHQTPCCPTFLLEAGIPGPWPPSPISTIHLQYMCFKQSELLWWSVHLPRGRVCAGLTAAPEAELHHPGNHFTPFLGVRIAGTRGGEPAAECPWDFP